MSVPTSFGMSCELNPCIILFGGCLKYHLPKSGPKSAMKRPDRDVLINIK